MELQPISDADHVRSRYSMYVGEPEAEHVANCLMRDAFCLAIDQVLAGDCSKIRVTFTSTGSASIDHDGAPPGVAPESRFGGKSETEMIVSVLGVCRRRAASEYVAEHVCHNSFPVVNFLSEQFRIDSFHASGLWSQSFARGVSTTPFRRLGPTDRSGVVVEFKPDSKLFPVAKFDVADMQAWFDELPLDRSTFSICWMEKSNSDRQ